MVGGEGAAWLQHGFYRLDKHTSCLLDRHPVHCSVHGVPRSGRREAIELTQQSMGEGFEAAAPRTCAKETHRSPHSTTLLGSP